MSEHIFRLAEIIREVDGSHNLGADALAEAILAHPGSRWQPTEESPDPTALDLLRQALMLLPGDSGLIGEVGNYLRRFPPCIDCGAMTEAEAERTCRVSSADDGCHGCELWSILSPPPAPPGSSLTNGLEGREMPTPATPATPSAQDKDSLAEVVLGLGLPQGDGARLITRALELWGQQPAPPAPTRHELNDAARLDDAQRIQRLRQALCEVIIACNGLATEDVSDEVLCRAPGEVRARLASVLRYGRPSVAPIPVSERLPKIDDCAEWQELPECDFWCWAWCRQQKHWLRTSHSYIARHPNLTHWAPYWAFPIPTQEDSK